MGNIIKILNETDSVTTDSGISIPEVFIFPTYDFTKYASQGFVSFDYKCWVSILSKDGGDVPFKLKNMNVDGKRVTSIVNYTPSIVPTGTNYAEIAKEAFGATFIWSDESLSIVDYTDPNS